MSLPWRVRDGWVVDADGRAVCICTEPTQSDLVVSCVNACDGLKPDAIKGLVRAAEKMAEETRTVVNVRQPVCETNILWCVRQLRSALAAVKEKQ